MREEKGRFDGDRARKVSEKKKSGKMRRWEGGEGGEKNERLNTDRLKRGM